MTEEEARLMTWIALKEGDGGKFFRAMVELINPDHQCSDGRGLVIDLEYAHGAVVEVAEKIGLTQTPDEAMIEELDQAIECYLRGVMALCANNKKRCG